MKRSSFFLIGLSITVLIICAAIFGPMLVKSDPVHNDLMSKLLPPLTDGHLLGTDQLGRDILARILYGARMSNYFVCCYNSCSSVRNSVGTDKWLLGQELLILLHENL